ncbi:MAG: prepilin-type N-terminal cleavage/methylation domain-containing protein [Patescibacteria group bacterium]|mgnify:CR=1 FL=1
MKYLKTKTEKVIKKTLYALRSTLYDKRGYSLIEMMVAVSLFTLVATVSISALISVNDANKKAQTMRSVIDNLNFAVENMARNLRVGFNYHCNYNDPSQPIDKSLDCASVSGASSVAFEAYNGDSSNSNDQIVYALNNNGQIMRSTNSGLSFSPLTPYNSSPSVIYQPLTIDYLTFFVVGTAAGDSKQPRVVIVVGGTARYNNEIQSKFQIQTSVSGRRIDS